MKKALIHEYRIGSGNNTQIRRVVYAADCEKSRANGMMNFQLLGGRIYFADEVVEITPEDSKTTRF